MVLQDLLLHRPVAQEGVEDVCHVRRIGVFELLYHREAAGVTSQVPFRTHGSPDLCFLRGT